MIDDSLVESLTELRKNIQNTLDFLNIEIKEDLERLKQWKKDHGDLFYRPNLGNNDFGSPTTTVLIPVASQFRSTIKSLLESIHLIETKLIKQCDDPVDSKPDEFAPEPIPFNPKAALREAMRLKRAREKQGVDNE
jgi:hypothetical protein